MQQHCLPSLSDNLKRAQGIRGGGRLGRGPFPHPFLLIVDLDLQPRSQILISPDTRKGSVQTAGQPRPTAPPTQAKAYSKSFPGPPKRDFPYRQVFGMEWLQFKENKTLTHQNFS